MSTNYNRKYISTLEYILSEVLNYINFNLISNSNKNHYNNFLLLLSNQIKSQSTLFINKKGKEILLEIMNDKVKSKNFEDSQLLKTCITSLNVFKNKEKYLTISNSISHKSINKNQLGTSTKQMIGYINHRKNKEKIVNMNSCSYYNYINHINKGNSYSKSLISIKKASNVISNEYDNCKNINIKRSQYEKGVNNFKNINIDMLKSSKSIDEMVMKGKNSNRVKRNIYSISEIKKILDEKSQTMLTFSYNDYQSNTEYNYMKHNNIIDVDYGYKD